MRKRIFFALVWFIRRGYHDSASYLLGSMLERPISGSNDALEAMMAEKDLEERNKLESVGWATMALMMVLFPVLFFLCVWFPMWFGDTTPY